MITEKKIVELIRKTATTLPKDIETALKKGLSKKNNEILETIEISKKNSIPLCQDTGTPIFYITSTPKQSRKIIMNLIQKALNKATKEVPLRPNAFDIISEKNVGNRAIFHFSEGKKEKVKLILKGGGSENITKLYTLPNVDLKAERNLAGIEKCILDAVNKAQGKGCPPYFVCVGVAGTADEAINISKEQLLRKVNDSNKIKELRSLENWTLRRVNSLGIGPLGLGGKTTAMAVKIGAGIRHPASYFVAVSFGCWCTRRGEI